MNPRTSNSTQRRRHDRRFRRLLPAVLAAATVATGVPALGAAPAGATAPSRAHVPPPAVRKAVVQRPGAARTAESHRSAAV